MDSLPTIMSGSLTLSAGTLILIIVSLNLLISSNESLCVNLPKSVHWAPHSRTRWIVVRWGDLRKDKDEAFGIAYK